MTDAPMTIEEKRALLARLRSMGARRRRWPLSHGQRAMWFLHQLAPDATAYNLGEALTLRGPLDVPALHRAVSRLVERHPIICSRVLADDSGELLQELTSPQTLLLTETDATDWDEETLSRRLTSDLDKPFDLTTGPLARLRLYRRGEDEHIVLLALHHIIGEFWSLVLLVRDLAALYDAEATGTEPSLPRLDREYADFVRWQHRLLSSEEGDRLWAYWRDTLSGDLPVLDLPTDHPRPAVKTYRGALHGFRTGPHTARLLREFTTATGATPYQTLLAAFGVFLHHHTGQRDLIIGSPMTGRLDASWTDLLGYFDNPLPLRLRPRPDMTFREAVTQAREAALGAFAHQAFPFPLLVERLQPPRDPSRSPLFDVMLVLRKAQSRELGRLAAMGMGEGAGATSLTVTHGLRAESREVPRVVSQFDLTLSLTEEDEDLVGSWEYNLDLFTPETIERFTARFTTLLADLLRNPDRPIGQATVLPADERRTVLVEWNNTAGPLPANACLHAGFLAMAAARPDAEALVAGTTRMTYGELDALSGQVAAALRAAGAGPERLVAICMRKGWEQVVAALAVSRSGAAYLPIDADFPASRIAELLELGGAEHVLVQPETRAAIPDNFTGSVIEVRASGPAETVAPPWPGSPRSTAYVIFTSGSTGTPKGVVIDHLGAVNTIDDINRRFGVGPGDRVLALSSLSFDLSVYDIFGVLAAGGTIVIPSADRLLDPLHWLELVRKERITIWNSVPALAQLLTEEAEHEDGRPLAALRLMLLSGDWIPVRLPDRLRALNPELDVISLGGATEASIWSIWYRIGEVPPSWTSIPYGRPLDNQRFYVLNEAGQPCPPGVQGELYIGGVGVARGYWRDPERTAERFIEHPELGRLYRTGDLGRYLPDGVIEFLGRADHQVKIHGFRVEPGEIESALRTYPGVHDAVVLALGPRDERRLVGFVQAEATTGSEELLAHARDRLPAYLVPSTIIVLTEFPLTRNGKVDRDALAALAAGHGAAYSPEHGPVTDGPAGLLCALLAPLVGRERVAPDESFFDLGGDSMTAVRLCSAARRSGLRITPAQVFNHPTMAELATVAAHTTEPDADDGSPPQADAYRLAPMQHTMFMHGMLADDVELYCEQIRLRLRGAVDAEALRRACDDVVARHDALRARFSFGPDGRPQQRFAPPTPVPFEIVTLPAGEDLEKLLREDRARGVPDLDSPMRWTLIRLGPDRHELIWTHHHILLDGWSLTIVVSELLQCYAARAAGQVPSLPPAPLYADYLRWLDRVDLEAHEEFWRKELAGLPGPTRLSPGRRPGFSHAEEELEFTAAETAELHARAAAMGVTVNTLFQGAWAMLLAKRTRERDVVLGVTIAGRPPELDNVDTMVGLFINTLPLRVDVDPEAPAGEWLRDIQRRQARISEHAAVTLADIERWSGVRGPHMETALFDTIVVFENYPTGDADPAAGLELAEVSFSEVTHTPFMLYVLPGASLRLRLSYNGAACDRGFARRLLAQLRSLVNGLAADPSRSVGLTPYGEREGLLHGGPLPSPAQDVLQLITAEARRRPHAIAVEHGSQRLTYRNLVDAASAVAARLRETGVGQGDLVAVMFPRGVEAVTAILGTLYAGAAYLPLDPESPPHRLTKILDDAQPVTVLTTAQHAGRFPDRQVIVLGDVTPGAPSPAATAPPAIPRAEDGTRAYVIYTSGSTGTPKGVEVGRGELAHFVAGATDRYAVAESDRILQFAPLYFDASVEEIFVTLCAGATLVIRDDGMLESLRRFCDACAERGITVLDLPTAYWHELVHALHTGMAELPDSIHTVIIGGEAATAERVAQWNNAVRPGVRLLNTYGPTEATVVATVADLTGARPSNGDVPIGRPLPGVGAVILDLHGQVAAADTVGELYLFGGGLAHGYLGAPELTADKFPRLHSLADHPRALRTGDLALARPAQGLIYAGRVDDQVKISGHRIDPAEVSDALLRFPGISAAAVAPRPGSATLIAYLAAPPPGPDIARLRDHLRQFLPPAAVPTSFVVMDRLPTTAQGKVDMAALQAMAVRPETGTGSPDPAELSREERLILEIWADVLGVEQLSPTDDFFQIGGQSLQIMQVANRLGAALGREIPLALLFRYPVAADLARALSDASAPRRAAALPPLATEDAILGEELPSITAPARTPARHALLTGATGFVGAHLLAELVRRTDLAVTCLIRADDDVHAANRLRAVLNRHGLTGSDIAGRVTAVAADLSLPGLGLSEERFAELAASCDVLYHCAAEVSLVRGYEGLRALNVHGTRNLLKLAATGPVSAVHHLSTLSVAPPAAGADVLPEDFIPAHPWLTDGYPQSKWVAEELLRQAADRGLPVSVYRLGRATGAASTGEVNPNDGMWQLLLASVRAGALPKVDASEVWTPVDYVAQAIVHLSLHDPNPARVYNLAPVGEVRLAQITEWLREYGYPVTLEEPAVWMTKIREEAGPLVGVIESRIDPKGDLDFGGLGKVACRNTERGLAGSGVVCAPVDSKLIHLYLDRCVEAGLLPSPPRPTRAT